MFYMHATYRGKVVQVHYHLKGRIFHPVFRQQGCEKRLWRIGNNYLSRHTSTKYQQLSAPFPGLWGHPYLSLLNSNPQEKYPQFQHRERITAFPYVVPCRHSHINLSLVSCSFIDSYCTGKPSTVGCPSLLVLNRSQSQIPQWRTIRLFCWIRKKGGGESPWWLIVVW